VIYQYFCLYMALAYSIPDVCEMAYVPPDPVAPEAAGGGAASSSKIFDNSRRDKGHLSEGPPGP
jgi:hypothetical protein